MKQEKFNTDQVFEGKKLRKLRVLIAPLDWGLGHTTRCIPVIYELLRQNCDVWLAAEGDQEVLLKQEFPQLSILPLRGYRVKYGRSASWMLWNILRQLPKILRTIKQENMWLKNMVAEHGFDAVISDNRYGLYHAAIPCIFITHQLNIKSKLGKWSERLLQKLNYKYINRFSECWLPDAAGKANLAGELSHPLKKPAIPLVYIGALSRFENMGDLSHISLVSGSLLIILSGPEPQRTFLENIIINDIAHYAGSAIIIRGLPATSTIIPSSNSIRFYNHLPTKELNNEMSRAGYIISRSGYSSIMDITKLQKKSILIPTPGQTEQEYLGKYLHEKRIAFSVSQKSFSLTQALEEANRFPYAFQDFENENNLRQTIGRFILSLRHH